MIGYKQLQISDILVFNQLLRLFGEVFEDMNTYQGAKPSEDYLKDFLRNNTHIVLVAQDESAVIVG